MIKLMNIRTKFKRGDEVKYISHLDLMKVFERAIRRSRLPIAYSQGFNPHPGMVFGLPLGVGVTSEAEYADFEITDDNMAPSEFMTRLNEQLPKGLEILAAKPRASKQNIMATISASEYYVLAGVDKACSEKMLKSGIRDFLAQNEIMVEKKTKSGLKNTDIRNMIFDLNIELQEADSFNLVKLSMLVSAGSKANLKPDLLTEALFNFLGFDFEIEKIHRTKLFVEAREQVLDPMDHAVL